MRFFLSLFYALLAHFALAQGWEKSFSGTISNIIAQPDGTILVTGGDTAIPAAVAFRLDSKGEIVWQSVEPGAVGARVAASCSTLDGNILLMKVNVDQQQFHILDGDGNTVFANNFSSGIAPNGVIELAPGIFSATYFSNSSYGDGIFSISGAYLLNWLQFNPYLYTPNWGYSYAPGSALLSQASVFGGLLFAGTKMVKDTLANGAEGAHETANLQFIDSQTGHLNWEKSVVGQYFTGLIRLPGGALMALYQGADAAIMEVKTDGELIELNRFAGVQKAQLAAAPDGSFILSGVKNGKAFLKKLTASGQEIWHRDFFDIHLPIEHLTVTATEEIYFSIKNAPTAYMVIKSDPDGNVYTNKATIQLKLDQNANCMADSLEAPLSNWKVQIHGNPEREAWTDAAGQAIFALDSGYYAVEVFPPDSQWLVCQPLASIYFNGFGNSQTTGLSIRDTCSTLTIYPLVSTACGEGLSSIQLEITGGGGSYMVQWAHGAEGSLITGLNRGTYRALIDDGGCKSNVEVAVEYERLLDNAHQYAAGGTEADGWSHILSLSNGGYLLTGFSESADYDLAGAPQKRNLLVARTNENGQQLWVRYFGGSGIEQGIKAVELPNGNYAVAGNSCSNDGDLDPLTNCDFWLLILDTLGNKLASRSYFNPDIENLSDLEWHDGYLWLAGTSCSDAPLPSCKSLLLKVAANADEIQREEIPNVLISDLEFNGTGELIVAGKSPKNFGLFHCWLAAFSSTIEPMWSYISDGYATEEFSKVRVHPDGSMTAFGFSGSSNWPPGNTALFNKLAVQFLPNGSLFGFKTFSFPGNKPTAYLPLENDHYLMIVDQNPTGFWAEINAEDSLLSAMDLSIPSDSFGVRSAFLASNGKILLAGTGNHRLSPSSGSGPNAMVIAADRVLFKSKIFEKNDLDVCKGEMVELAIPAPNAIIQNITWENGDTTGIIHFTAQNDTVLAVEGIGLDGCRGIDQLKIHTRSLQVQSFVEQPYCHQSNGKIEIKTHTPDGSGYFVNWSDGSMAQNRTNLEPGSYAVTIQSNVCTVQDTFSLHANVPNFYLKTYMEDLDSSWTDVRRDSVQQSILLNDSSFVVLLQGYSKTLVLLKAETGKVLRKRQLDVKKIARANHGLIGIPGSRGNKVALWLDDSLRITDQFYLPGGASCVVQSVAVNSEGAAFLLLEPDSAGQSIWSGGYGKTDVWVLKINSDHSLGWLHHYGGSFADKGVDLATDNAGNVWVTAAVRSTDFDLITNSGGTQNIWLFQLDDAGQIQFSTIIGGNEHDRPRRIFTGNGTILLVNDVRSSDGPWADIPANAYLIQCYSETGSLNWQQSIPSLEAPNDQLHAQALPGGEWNIYVKNASEANAFYRIDSLGAILYSRLLPYPTAFIAKDTVWHFFSIHQLFYIPSGIHCCPIYGQSLGMAKFALSSAAPSLTLPMDTLLCLGDTLALQAQTYAPYFSWSTGDSTKTLLVVNPGIYVATAVEAPGCETRDSVRVDYCPGPMGILEPDSLSGCAPVVLSLNNENFEYVWSDGSTGSQFKATQDGVIWVSVTTYSGLVYTDSVYIDVTENALVCTATLTHPSCHGDDDGEIDVHAATPYLPAFFHWGNGDLDSVRTGLTGGFYPLTISDASGCGLIDTAFLLESPFLINADTFYKRQTCFGDMDGFVGISTPVGGEGPYTCHWNTNDTTWLLTNLGNGTFIATVVDSRGCTAIMPSFTLNTTPIMYTVTLWHPTDSGAVNGRIKINLSGGTPNYTVLWNNGQMGNVLDSISHGTYAFTVFDSHGCTKTGEVELTVPIAEPELLDAIQLWPNPSNGVFSIIGVAEKEENVHVEIYNMIGEKVQETAMESDVDARGLADGAYFIVLKTNTLQKKWLWVKT